MEFFCYHRDRVGSTPLRVALLEEHWAYMDGFADTMIARGPTFTSDGVLSGSVHILELPDPAAAHAFAFEEPCYQAGAYRDVMVRRWRNRLGRTMWDNTSAASDPTWFLVLGFCSEPGDADLEPGTQAEQLIAFGPLLSDDAARTIGAAALIEAPDADSARTILSPERFEGIEVHQWRPGGRPS